MFTGSVVTPVSAEAVMVPLAPTFTVATTNTPVPVFPGMFTIPGSGGSVPANATTSGTAEDDAEKRSVFNPELIGAGLALLQLKLNCTSVDAIGAVGVNEMIKLRAAPAAISPGELGLPVT